MNTFSHYLSALLFISSILPSPAALSLPPLFLSPQDATTIVEIQNLINLFAVAVDQHRWDLLAQVFEPDVTADFNVPDAPVAHGLDAVIQLLRRLEGYPSYHSQGSHYVDLSNPQRPHAVTYVTGTFFLPNRLHTSYGRYEDDLVRTAQGWRIISRTFVNTAFSEGHGSNITVV